MKDIKAVFPAFDTDPQGRPLALVVYDDQTHQRFYHEELDLRVAS